MKKLYILSSGFFCCLLLALSLSSHAQCADGNAPTPVFMDTTIFFEPGVTSTQVKFPKFDPENGMLRCVKLTIFMIGVVDTVAMQNLSNFSQTAQFNYIRTDEMTGPGLATPISNSRNKNYGPYSVTGFDGNYHTGTDYVPIPRDTVLNQTVVRQLTDSTEISNFYGRDSVVYNYSIDVRANATMTGGSSMFLVRTSAQVRFRFEYCTCAKVTLPLGLKNFTASKTSSQTANLTWEAEKDESVYWYQVEVSRDGRHFTNLGTVEKKSTAATRYFYPFTTENDEQGTYYFRVQQRWPDGTTRYTAIKTVAFSHPAFENISLFPNPSNGQVGLKFVNGRGGKMRVQVTNAGGQQVLLQDLQVQPTDYKLLGNLPTGTYWIKLTDLSSQTSCVKQLIVH